MPTGYTAEIKDGITFEKFILGCARNFGALIMMRDEEKDAPIPDKFEPSDYYSKALANAKKELLEFELLSNQELDDLYVKDYEDQYERWERYEGEKLQTKLKYEAMLKSALKWEPPTKDHTGLKEFMISQIKESIEFDCYKSDKPEQKPFKVWKIDKLQSLQKSVLYHTKSNDDEIRRQKERSEWVVALKQSLNLQTIKP